MSSITRKSKNHIKQEKNIFNLFFKVYQCTKLIAGAGLKDVRTYNYLFTALH